ncbi:MAG: DNA repair protein RecO [Bacteroidia bacterium]
MIKKTEAIVLKAVKHQESNLIVRLFTRDFGAKSFIITGYGSARSRTKYSYFQPLSLVEIVFIEKLANQLPKISESRALTLLNSVQIEPIKISLGLTMLEIVYDCMKEEEPDAELFEMLTQLVHALEEKNDRLIHYFFYFLVQFTRILGFFPNNEVKDVDKVIAFDLPNGTLRNQVGGDTKVCQMILWFMYTSLENCQDFSFSQLEKRNFLSTLFSYYYHHIQGFKYPKTIQVFAEVFE